MSEAPYKVWQCRTCGYIYEEEHGDPGGRAGGGNALGRHSGGLGLPAVRHAEVRLRHDRALGGD
jgi:hypothetical protein